MNSLQIAINNMLQSVETIVVLTIAKDDDSLYGDDALLTSIVPEEDFNAEFVTKEVNALFNCHITNDFFQKAIDDFLHEGEGNVVLDCEVFSLGCFKMSKKQWEDSLVEGDEE